MLKTALVITLLVSSGMAYALNNNDLMQLNLRMSRQQEGQQVDMERLLEPRELAKVREGALWQEQIWRQQQEQLKQKQYLQEVLMERQRQQDAHRLEQQRGVDALMQRRQSELFQ